MTPHTETEPEVLRRAAAANRALVESLGQGLPQAAAQVLREYHIDAAVRAVMRIGRLPQGYQGTIPCDRNAVAYWLAEGAPTNAWWFAFTSAVQTYHRRSERARAQAEARS